MAPISRTRSRSAGAFSQREMVGTAVGQPPAGELEGRVAAQPVEIVGVLIAAGNGEDASAQDVGQ